MKKKEEEGLLGFNWEEDGEDFFNIEGAVVAPKKEEKKEVKKDLEDEEEEEGEEEIETPTNFFEVEEEEQEEDDEDEEDSSKKAGSTSSIYTDVYKDLKEQGIFRHVEAEEGEELDSDKLFELQQEEYEAEVNARLVSWATEELDEDAKAFIKFKRDGGETQDFFKTYSNSTNIPTGDITEEDHQDSVIRYQLRQEGWDSDEIEDRLKYLTDSGRKEKVAKKYNTKLKDADKAEKELTLKEAAKQKDLQKAQEEDFRSNIKSTLQNTKDISGVKISEKDKTQLYNFLTKKSYKVSDTKSITGFQKKLGETFQDTDKMILLAKLINSDFDMKGFEKATITKKTKQIKSNLEQRKGLRPTNSGSSLEGNSLADLF